MTTIHLEGFWRVGEVLGAPPVVDTQRPNEMGHATPYQRPVNGESLPADYPLFWVVKECRLCAKVWEGWCAVPQYDDSPVYAGWCGCLSGRPVAVPRYQPRTYASAAPAEPPQDPLADD